MTPVELVRVIKRHEDAWKAIPGVIGVGGSVCGDDGWVVVYTDRAGVRRRLPRTVDGVRVECQRTRNPLLVAVS